MLRQAILLCLPKELVNRAKRALIPIDLLDKNSLFGKLSIGKRRLCVNKNRSQYRGALRAFPAVESGTVFTRLINFPFFVGSGRWQKSKHQAAGQSPLTAPHVPVPVSRLNRTGLWESLRASFPSAIPVKILLPSYMPSQSATL